MTDEQREAEKRLQRVRAELVESERPWLGVGRAMRILVVLLALNTLLSTGWTCVVTGMAGSDPLFGAHADMLCPTICDGCAGPYGYRATTTIEGSAARTDDLYCYDRDGGRHPVPGGVWYVGLTMMAAALPFALLIVAFLSVVGRRNYLARRESRRRAVAEAERKLQVLGAGTRTGRRAG